MDEKKRAAGGDGAGFVSNAVDDLILWGVAILFSPWIVRDRLRRRRERRSAGGAEQERAVQELVRAVKEAGAPRDSGGEPQPHRALTGRP